MTDEKRHAAGWDNDVKMRLEHGTSMSNGTLDADISAALARIAALEVALGATTRECQAGIDGGCGACEVCDPLWWKKLADDHVAALEAELWEIDSLIFDASADLGDVEHNIEMHASTLPQFVRLLAAHLRKIDGVGETRRQKAADALEPKVTP